MLTKQLIAVPFIFATAIGVLGLVVPKFQLTAIVLCLLCIGLGVLLAINLVSQHLWEVDANVKEIQAARSKTLVEIHAMLVVLRRFPDCDMPTTPWSMDFTNLHALIDLLDRKKPEIIVEFGSGISTIIIAGWLREQGKGQLISFDHDSDWASVTKRYVERHSFTNVTIKERALRPQTCQDRSMDWYDIEDDLASLNEIDLVVVDGPPAGTTAAPDSRLPAFFMLRDRMSSVGTFFLDDATRPGEQAVIASWRNSDPKFHMSLVAGAAILELDR